MPSARHALYFLLDPFCESALPAAVLAALLDEGLLSTLEAAFAALGLVWRVFFAMVYLDSRDHDCRMGSRWWGCSAL